MVTTRNSIGNILDWLDITQLFLLVSACIACFNWGKLTGITGTINMLLSKKVITEKDLEKISDL